jgi:hypothetical protein
VDCSPKEIQAFSWSYEERPRIDPRIVEHEIKTSTHFYPFQLVHGVESILSIECEIPSLKLEIELLPETSDLEERLVHLEHLDEQRRDASTNIKVNK